MKIILCLLLIFVAQAQGADWQKLDGIYALSPSAYLNPAEDAIEDSHLRLQLKGKSAEDLYQAMKGEPVVDDCTGGLAKNAGICSAYISRERQAMSAIFPSIL